LAYPAALFHYGLNDFIICLGYKGYVIKEYFANYVLHRSDILVDVEKNRIEYLGSQALPPWRVALVDTGLETKTGGRLKRIAGHLSADEPFCMTYGDGVSDVDLMSLITFHKKTGLAATLTAVRPLGRFGATVLEGARVKSFMEKPECTDWLSPSGVMIISVPNQASLQTRLFGFYSAYPDYGRHVWYHTSDYLD
jgi:glucose-1-phosphate cytidylyltransferase